MPLSAIKKKKMITLLQVLQLLLLLKKRRSRVRSIGVQELFKKRRGMDDLVDELRVNSEMFFNYTRLNTQRFDYLLGLVGPLLQKRKMVTSISPSQRLAMTLRHLAGGDSHVSLSVAYRCGRATVCVIIRETLAAIIKVLHRLVISAPNNPQKWKTVASGFGTHWNLPHCVGAIDGRHMQIQCPEASGSTFYSYKDVFSIHLMAIASYDYSFIAVDVGAEGSLGDGAVLKDSVFGQKLEAGTLNLPEPEPLPNSDKTFGYYFVGDAAFQLRRDLMKPFAARKLSIREAIYNYRISRARRIVENAFGVLVNRWRLFRQPLCCHLNTANLAVLAAVCLHNLIIRSREPDEDDKYMPASMVDRELADGTFVQGTWRADENGNGAILPVPATRNRNATKSATSMREVLADYVNAEGAVQWQENYVRRGFWGAHITE